MILADVPGPTPLWYATRGSGYAALVLLTATVVLGLLTSVRWHRPGWPRFLSQTLHRNLSLMVVVFVIIHVVASIVDPFAGLSPRDAVVPFTAGYRPLWLGLGVVSLELLVAIVVTSLLRNRLSWRMWQAVHLLAYVSWPVAVLHTIGTGTDTKSAWALLLNVACVGAVVVALVWRLSIGWPRQALLRTAGITLSIAGVVALTAWTASGPLQAGWARAAGTPANLLASGAAAAPSPTPTPAPAIAAGLSDPLTGRLQQSDVSTTAVMTDERDTTLIFTIVANADGSATLAVDHNGTRVCRAPATLQTTVQAQCGSVIVQIQIARQSQTLLSGTLTTTQAGQ